MSLRAAARLIALMLLVPPLAQAKECDHVFANALVLNAIPGPFDSGVFRVYSKVRIRTRDGFELWTYQIHLSEKQFLPARGQVCRVQYTLKKLGGGIAARGETLEFNKPVPVVCSFECRP
jgi:hypothetical protein